MDDPSTIFDQSVVANTIAITRIVDLAASQIPLGEEEDCLQAQHCIKLAMNKERDAETRARLMEGAAARLIVCALNVRKNNATSD